MFRAVDKWLIGYLKSVLSSFETVTNSRHLIFCLVDHYEPFRDGVSDETAHEYVANWRDKYPDLFSCFRDSDSRPPLHTFFYPEEEYSEKALAMLSELCVEGYGEVEVHLHHRDDTKAGLRKKISVFCDLLRSRHGFLGTAPDGRIGYGFIHGNWALCNSRPDGDWCGVNEEIGVLAETGCYADFTFPSAPSPTQPRVVNQLYYARDNIGKPRGYDKGVRVSAGCMPVLSTDESGKYLLMVQGPLALDWKRRKFGLLPRIDNGELSGVNPPTEARVNLWTGQHIHVSGRPEWVFVKVHTHGCVPGNMRVLLSGKMQEFHESLLRNFNDGEKWQLHYATARETFNIVKAAEAGKKGSPGDYRDFLIKPPSFAAGCEKA